MSKIICDVCGTSYPENANQCPICGCVRSVDVRTVSGSTAETDEATGTYTYVKGGRFSKKNVKKRNQERAAGESKPLATQEPEEKKTKKADKGLLITVVVLLLAIVAVLVYITVRFLVPGLENGTTGKSTIPDITTTAPTTVMTILDVPCEELTVSDSVVELKSVGAIQLLSVKTAPADTTDALTFTSSDDSIATVDAEGKIEAVAPGQADITITCGEKTATCRVTCTFEVETTAPSTEAPTQPVYNSEDLQLLKSDVTLTKKGEVWLCYKGKIPADQITWTTDNEKVATVENGKVTAVATGNTKIYGEYGDVKVTCIVRCSPNVGAYVEPEETTEATESVHKYHLNTDNESQKNDITIEIGESFTFRLLDASNDKVDAEFTCSNVLACTLENSTVTGVAVGTANVVVEYEGETHICIVRVKEATA